MFRTLIDDLANDIILRERYTADPDAVISEYGLDDDERRLLRSRNAGQITIEYRKRVLNDGTPHPETLMTSVTVIVVVIESPRAQKEYWDEVVTRCEDLSVAA